MPANTTTAGVFLFLAAVPTFAAEEYVAPRYRPNPSTAPILAHVKPGGDAFPLEKPAEEIGDRLAELAKTLREDAASDIRARFLAATFQGASLRPAEEKRSAGSGLSVFRGGASTAAPEAARFREE